jgi:putative flippase GtrA
MTSLSSSVPVAVDKRLLRFAIVGGSNTLVAVAIYWLLIEVGVPYLTAAALGYAAGIANGYTWNRLWTFETGRFHLPELSRFVLVQGAGLVVNLFLLYLFVDELGIAQGPSEILSVAPVFLLTYSFNRWWTFRPKTAAGAK